jgi:hypothetical protein
VVVPYRTVVIPGLSFVIRHGEDGGREGGGEGGCFMSAGAVELSSIVSIGVNDENICTCIDE